MVLESFTGIASNFLSFFIILFVLGFVLSVFIGTLALYYFKVHRYKHFRCVIFERDGFGQLTKTYDNAGIFVDKKTGNKRLYIKKAYVGLDPDNIPYIVDNKGKKTIYLYRTGLKNYHYIKINIKQPGITLTVGEEDVNWAINAYERAKKTFSNSLLMQLMPYIALAFVSIVILIIFIINLYIMNKY